MVRQPSWDLSSQCRCPTVSVYCTSPNGGPFVACSCAWCASDPTCVVANFDIADSACWLKVAPYTVKANPMDKGGVFSLYLCRRDAHNDPALLQLNAVGGCKPQARGWTLVATVLIGASLYLAFGLAYSVKVKELPLTREAIPHVEFWRQLAGLVTEGMRFAKNNIGKQGNGGGGVGKAGEEGLLEEEEQEAAAGGSPSDRDQS